MWKRLPALVLLIVLLPALALAAPITSISVFGDSLSDQGRGYLLTGGAFPPSPYAQRASNGPVAVEFLAAQLGVTLAPAAPGTGTNYAVLGAATGPVTFASIPVTTDNFAAVAYGQPALLNTGILNQVLTSLLAGPVTDPAGSLFVVWGGPNDFFINASPTTAANAVSNIATAVMTLYGNGARRFLVPNMPDLALTPYGLGLPPPQADGLRALTMGFNAGLQSALNGLSLLPGIDITPFDTFGLLTAINANPAAYGFTNAGDPCLIGSLGGGIVSQCANPDEYVFWDSVHPTTAAHRVVGNAFAAAVPEPATLSLLVLAVTVTVARRRRSAH